MEKALGREVVKINSSNDDGPEEIEIERQS